MASVSIADAPAPARVDRSTRILFTITILVSSFLLFLIQPMYARMMLPRVGGAPVVWNAALVFFQGVLLVGYYYAHVFSKKLGPVKHAKWHWIALVLPLFVLPLTLRVLPGVVATAQPVMWLLGTLALGVGLPYVVVATTSPLIQRWFATTNDPIAEDPYFLYAASNIGSFAALMVYPLWMEPRITLTDQGRVWGGLYVVMAVLVFLCSRRVGTRHEDLDDTPAQPISTREILIWGFLAFVPSSLMVGTTTFITTSVASAPLLWVVPLGLYLLTFVLAFAKRQWVPQWLLTIVGGAAIIFALVFNLSGFAGLEHFKFAVTLVTFFLVAWMVHTRLASRRPPHQHLTTFYFVMSAGGVLGGLFAGLLAPVVFERVLEYPITLALAAAAVFPLLKKTTWWDAAWFFLAAILYVGLTWFSEQFQAHSWLNLQLQHNLSQRLIELTIVQKAEIVWIPLATFAMLGIFRPMRFFGGIVVVAIVGILFDRVSNKAVVESRSYFGTLRVSDSPGGWYRSLVHGTILHGVQSLKPKLRDEPSSYYCSEGPIGDIVRDILRPDDAHIGIVGCGVGTMTAYGKPGQHWTIFELDPDVRTIATTDVLFTYISHCKAEVKFAMGDARLKLSESPEKFDLIVLDAYSSDNIPLHLMTVEAFQMYIRQLAPRGVIAVHISNRFLDLKQQVALISQELGLAQRHKYSMFETGDTLLRFSSEWMAVARSEADIAPLTPAKGWTITMPEKSVRVWTDERASILDVLEPDWYKKIQ